MLPVAIAADGYARHVRATPVQAPPRSAPRLPGRHLAPSPESGEFVQIDVQGAAPMRIV